MVRKPATRAHQEHESEVKLLTNGTSSIFIQRFVIVTYTLGPFLHNFGPMMAKHNKEGLIFTLTRQ